MGLLDRLCGAPPLCLLKRRDLEVRKERIKAHYDIFSPLDREIAMLPVISGSRSSLDMVLSSGTLSVGTSTGKDDPDRGLVPRSLDNQSRSGR